MTARERDGPKDIGHFWPWTSSDDEQGHRQGRYETYLDYVRVLTQKGFKYQLLADYLETGRSGNFPKQSFCVSVIDIRDPSSDDETLDLVNHKFFQYRGPYSNLRTTHKPNEDWEKVTTDIIETFRLAPREETKTRVIIMELLSFLEYSAAKLLDALGILLDLDPGIVYGIAEARTAGHMPLDWPRTYTRLYGRFSSQILGFQRPSGESFSVVLIISATPSNWKRPFHGALLNQRPHTSDSEVSYVPLAERVQERPHGSVHGTIGWYSIAYRYWVHDLTSKEIIDSNEDPYEFLYPWVEYQIHDVHANMQELREVVEGQQDNLFDAQKVAAMVTRLKRYLPYISDLFGTLRTQIHASLQGKQPTKGLARQLQFGEDTLLEARDLLRIVGEELQLEATLQSIQESQRAIEETISVNRLTSLAFFFLPLSLVASIFGMNLKQLNGNGPDLKYFIITSIILFIITIIGWAAITKILHWWTSSKVQREHHGLMNCYIILWKSMIRKQVLWTIRPNEFIALLTDHALGDPKAYHKVKGRLEE